MPLTLTDHDGALVIWTDPDALPGTIGDSAEESLRTMRASGHPSVRVIPREYVALWEENAALKRRLADAGLE